MKQKNSFPEWVVSEPGTTLFINNLLDVEMWANIMPKQRRLPFVDYGNIIGFVYEITFSDGKKYIGKKCLFSIRKKKFTKKELAAVTDKRLKTYHTIKSESNWKDYYGSLDKEVIEKVKSGELRIIKREILELASKKSQLTYLEAKYLFNRGVIEFDNYYNGNILGKFYRGSI